MCSTGHYWCAQQESIMGGPWESNGVLNGKLLCAQLNIVGVLNGKSLCAQWEIIMCSMEHYW